MATTILEIHGGGDWSVGISDMHAIITVQDNLMEHTKEYVDDLKNFFAEFYDIPRKIVVTQKEYYDDLEREEKQYREFERKHPSKTIKRRR